MISPESVIRSNVANRPMHSLTDSDRSFGKFGTRQSGPVFDLLGTKLDTLWFWGISCLLPEWV
jgi:hypothetical protein